MARGLLGRNSPLQMRHQRRAALKAADVVLIAGMPCDFRLGYGRAINAQARLISVNRNRGDLNLNRKPDLGVLGDPGRFLIALGDQMKHVPSAWDAWHAQLMKKDADRDQAIEVMAGEHTDVINPVRFLKVLEKMLPDNSTIIADGGDFVATAAYILKPRQPLSWLDPGVFGTLGVGAGFGLGTAVSRPGTELWLIYGDGAAGYSLQEFDTFVRHGIPLIAVVGNDGSWAQIARDQVQILNDDVATVLRRTDYHRVVEGYGAKGFLLEDEGNIETVLSEARQAAAHGTPVLINVLIGKSDFRRGSISM
jgi:acetolactate synthase-1/2/3 large subunit